LKNSVSYINILKCIQSFISIFNPILKGKAKIPRLKVARRVEIERPIDKNSMKTKSEILKKLSIFSILMVQVFSVIVLRLKDFIRSY